MSEKERPVPARPRPAAEGAGDAPAQEPQGSKGARRQGRVQSGGRKKPTPVRQLSETTPPPSPETDVQETVVATEEGEWTVRVVGRGGGTRSSPPLLLLGFWRQGSEEPEHERETLVVGRLLSDLQDARLRDALADSRPPLSGDRPRPFFSEGGGRRRKPSS